MQTETARVDTQVAGQSHSGRQRPPTSNPEPLAVGAKEAARMCGLSERSWWRMVSSGQAPAGFRVGSRRRLWRYADVSEWVRTGFPSQSGNEADD